MKLPTETGKKRRFLTNNSFNFWYIEIARKFVVLNRNPSISRKFKIYYLLQTCSGSRDDISIKIIIFYGDTSTTTHFIPLSWKRNTVQDVYVKHKSTLSPIKRSRYINHLDGWVPRPPYRFSEYLCVVGNVKLGNQIRGTVQRSVWRWLDYVACELIN